MRNVLLGCAAAVVLASWAGGAAAATIDPGVAATLVTLAPGAKTSVVVTLRDRADLNAIHGSTRAARLRATVLALQATSNVSQVRVRALLRRRTAEGKVDRTRPFWVANAISVTATADVIRELAAFPGVERITPDDVPIIPTAGAPEPNLAAVDAPAAWGLGYTGQGVVVASLDSGVDVSHPDLASRFRGGTNSWFDPYGQHPAAPVDLTGHGTGVMGVMVGGDAGGTSVGMAPGARWIAARIFNDAGGSTATAIHAAFQWLLDPDGDPNTADAPNVVNNSWSYGYGSTCNLAFQPDLQALRAAGIVPVFAAGNFGPYGSTSVSPANYPEAFAVGAVNGSDAVYSPSSRGPSACGEPSTVYPELVAPGVGIRTTDRYGLFQTLSGTSLAAPHVAGALALLLSAHPGLTPAQQELALEQGARDLGAAGPDNTYGFGRLSVLGALNALNAPDFALVAAPSSLATVAGGSVGSTLTVSASNGFAADVSLVVSGAPAGVTASLTPALVAGGAGSSQLVVATAASVPVGTYALTVTGSGGASSHSVGVSLVVTAPPDFALVAAPSSLATVAGGSVGSTLTVSALNGFAADVSLVVSGAPAGVTASLTPALVAGGAGSSQLVVATAASVPVGTYALTVTGSGGASSHSVGVSLVVTAPPDFALVAAPSSLATVAGGSVGSTLTVSALNGFAADVSLVVSGAPAGVTASLTPALVAGGAGSSQLVVATAASVPVGTYALTVTGSGGASSHSVGVSLVVTAPPDFALVAAPSSLATVAGGSVGSTLTVSSLNGFTGAVGLSLAGLTPTQATWSFAPATVAGGAGSSQLSIVTAATLPAGTYTLTVTGASGATSHAASLTLVVSQPPDFTVAVTPGLLSVRRGSQGTLTVSVGSVAGFSSAVTLSVSGLPGGVTSSFSRNPVTPGGQSTLTLRASTQASRGTFTITVKGTGGGKTHLKTVTLTVT